METLYFNPYVTKRDISAKILTAQIKIGDSDAIVLKEWELGESELIGTLYNIILHFNYDGSKRTYNNIFTYNGRYDFHYLMCRAMECFGKDSMLKMFKLFILNTKHCDLMQYDNGYFVSLKNLCRKHGIKRRCEYYGKDMSRLYFAKDYDNIVLHALDDVEVLHKLVTKHGFGRRFL